MIEFEDIDKRLVLLGKDRVWLSKEADYSEAAVREALAPNSKKRSARLQAALSDAIEREETRQRATTPPLQNLVLEVPAETFERWARAGLKHGEIVTEYALRAIEEAAARDAVVEFRKPEIPSRVAEDLGVYHARFLGGVAAGTPGQAEVLSVVTIHEPIAAGNYVLRVDGTSMEPTIPDGSLIEVRPLKDGEFPRQKTIVVYNDGTGATLKRFGYRRPEEGEEEKINAVGKVAILKSDNPKFKEIQTLEGGKIVAVYEKTIQD